ncbi:MAG: amidohydrolase [Sphingobacteriia bacterium]|nr:MAG: amidohydrolase [Sphingobacteriia bacterium]
MSKIIDTHLHTWDLDQLEYYWLKGDESILAKSYFVADIAPQLKNANINAAILVQATNSLAETDWLLRLAELNACILGTVVWLPLMQPQQVAAAIDKYKANPYFCGVRHQIHDEVNPAWLLQPEVMESLGILEEYDIPFDLVGTKLAHIETALKLAHQLPNLRMVFDHLNQPPAIDTGAYHQWKTLMIEAAQHPRFFAKISGLGTAIGNGKQWCSKDISYAIEFIIAGFGVDRIFCGGDWPVSLLAGSYGYTWQQYQLVIDDLLSVPNANKLYTTNAELFYRVKSL